MVFRPVGLALPQAIRFGRTSPSLPKSRTFIGDLAEKEKAAKVNRIELEGPDPPAIGQNAAAITEYNIGGDHLYCDRIDGSSPAYVRLNGKQGVPIRLQEGLVVRRLFEKFAVSFDWPQFQDDRRVPGRFPRTKVLLFATYGPFIIEKPMARYGARPGFLTRFSCLATTTPRVVWVDAMEEFSLFNTDPTELFGLDGASLVVKNTDLANTLFLKYTEPTTDIAPAEVPGSENWFPIEPGQSLEMTLDSIMRRQVTGLGAAGVFTSNICVATRSGTCSYAFILSRTPTFGPPQGYAGEFGAP